MACQHKMMSNLKMVLSTVMLRFLITQKVGYNSICFVPSSKPSCYRSWLVVPMLQLASFPSDGGSKKPLSLAIAVFFPFYFVLTDSTCILLCSFWHYSVVYICITYFIVIYYQISFMIEAISDNLVFVLWNMDLMVVCMKKRKEEGERIHTKNIDIYVMGFIIFNSLKFKFQKFLICFYAIILIAFY